MEGYWRQGLVISLALHALILGLGGLYGLLRQPDPSEPSPIQARLVAPQPKSAQPEQKKPEPKKPEPQKAETKSPPEQPSKAEKEPPRTERKAATPPPPEEPEKATKPDSATRAVAAAPEEATEAEESAEAESPEPPETQAKAEPKEPEVKEPEKVAIKKEVAKKVPEEPSEPEKSESSDPPEPKQAEKEPADPRETQPEEPPAGKKAETKEAAPEPPKEETEESDAILSESLSEKIARLSENGGQEQASLRQRRAVARFQDVVRSRIRNQWLIPPGLGDQSGLEATVRLALTPEGKLAAPPRIVTSNGPGHFNSSVLRAVRKAAPFPMPDGPTQYFQNLELHFSPDMVQ